MLESKIVEWVLQQSPTVAISTVVILYLLRRNAALSDALIASVRENSEERLRLTKEHADERLQMQNAHSRERDQLQTRSLLEHDATLRHIFHSFELGLGKMLSALGVSLPK